MQLDAVINFGKVTVSGAYDELTYSITVSDGTRFPDPETAGEYNVVWYNDTDYPDPADDPDVEIDRVIAVSGNVLTLANNGSYRTPQEGTEASDKNIQGKTYKMILGITAKMITDILALIPTSIADFMEAPTSGTIDNVNTVFGFSAKPFVISINGTWYFLNNGWTWNSEDNEATLQGPVGIGGSIEGLI